MAKKKRQKKEKLYAKDPFCFWCRRSLSIYGILLSGQPHPEDMATLDHLRSRLNPERRNGLDYPGQIQIVLSCPGCNKARSDKEQEKLGIDELRRRAKAYPGIGRLENRKVL